MPSTYELVRRTETGTRRVAAGSAVFGDGGFALIGGPCSIENREQMATVAACVARAGGAMLRGGAYKPRTSPYDFQGLGALGVRIMAEAAHEHRIPAVTEVLAVEHAGEVAAHVAMIQIGARNMQNVPLLQAAARTGNAILLKRGVAATLDEVLHAAEYIALAGNERIVLCERGIRGFDAHTRNVLDIGGALRLKELTHLPVIVDPSHGCGRRSLVEPLVYAAAAAGLDGAIVEVHPRPDESVSDAAQAIDCATFARIAQRLAALYAVSA
ncbi:MAG: 3-deoxy-7-phosphoheptulonate synthase [Candidatus Velthaea sp.]